MTGKRKAAVVALTGGLLVGLGIQLIPADRRNPAVVREIAWDAPRTGELARRACYDCHSNETVWPWYSSIAPASWLIAKDVDEGREHLNFSEWDGPNEGLDEVIDMVESGEMPLSRYVVLHRNAALTEPEKTELIRGLRETFAADPPAHDAHGESEAGFIEGSPALHGLFANLRPVTR